MEGDDARNMIFHSLVSLVMARGVDRNQDGLAPSYVPNAALRKLNVQVKRPDRPPLA